MSGEKLTGQRRREIASAVFFETCENKLSDWMKDSESLIKAFNDARELIGNNLPISAQEQEILLTHLLIREKLYARSCVDNGIDKGVNLFKLAGLPTSPEFV